jgi:hypothetical protein
MSGPLAAVSAGGTSAGAPRIMPGQAYEVTLLPQEQVHLPLPPAQDRGGAGRSAGVLSLGNLPRGRWRVSTDNPVWLDLAASGQSIPSSDFEMKMECPTILKSVVFAVPGNAPVLLQVNGATKQSVRLLITPAEAAR